MTTPPDEPLLLTVDNTAALLSVSRNTVFKLLRSGDLASMTIGAKRLIPRQEVDRFIRERTRQRPTRHAETAL